jgi:hypothetical protein
MGKKPENLLVGGQIGALRQDSHLSAALRKRILEVGNDPEAPAFMRAVLAALVHCCDQPGLHVRLADVQSWLGVHRQLWLSERTIKKAVMLLVADYGIQVGSSRSGKPSGYYFITTLAEAESAIAPLLSEAKSLLRRVNHLSPCRSYFRRMVGQLEVEL